ncbi:hypothetical protein GWI33_011796 [Rhynchophorus ferrugineus]|uniref:Uncharacterized protein n=1 Tax=Rhynchophorus ferrugineus TaxID=354439 RepID=A0A834IC96_RHYFE|nr:hypothetical protein GWI33_011796 [Rhynchophorus ferrugineus]
MDHIWFKCHFTMKKPSSMLQKSMLLKCDKKCGGIPARRRGSGPPDRLPTQKFNIIFPIHPGSFCSRSNAGNLYASRDPSRPHLSDDRVFPNHGRVLKRSRSLIYRPRGRRFDSFASR